MTAPSCTVAWARITARWPTTHSFSTARGPTSAPCQSTQPSSTAPSPTTQPGPITELATRALGPTRASRPTITAPRQVGREVHPRALVEPDVAVHALDLAAGGCKVDLPLEEVEVGEPVLHEVPDVSPVASRHVARHRTLLAEERREQVLAEVVLAAGGDRPEERRLEEVDPGVDRVAEDLAPGGLLQEPRDPPGGVGDDDAVGERVLHAGQHHGRLGLGLLVERDRRAEVEVGDDVPRDHQDRLAQPLRGELHRPRRAQVCGRGDVVDPHAPAAAVLEVLHDRLGQEVEQDEDVVEPVGLQELHGVLHDRLVAERHHGLWHVGGQRPEPGSEPPGHEDGFHGDCLGAIIAIIRDLPPPPQPPSPTHRGGGGAGAAAADLTVALTSADRFPGGAGGRGRPGPSRRRSRRRGPGRPRRRARPARR